MIYNKSAFFIGNLHDLVVELEGMGGGGKLKLEVSSLVNKILVKVHSSRKTRTFATLCNSLFFIFLDFYVDIFSQFMRTITDVEYHLMKLYAS